MPCRQIRGTLDGNQFTSTMKSYFWTHGASPTLKLGSVMMHGISLLATLSDHLYSGVVIDTQAFLEFEISTSRV